MRAKGNEHLEALLVRFIVQISENGYLSTYLVKHPNITRTKITISRTKPVSCRSFILRDYITKSGIIFPTIIFIMLAQFSTYNIVFSYIDLRHLHRSSATQVQLPFTKDRLVYHIFPLYIYFTGMEHLRWGQGPIINPTDKAIRSICAKKAR